MPCARFLAPLAERGLVVYLTPEDRRGTVITHGFHEAAELERLRTRAAEGGHSTPEPSTRSAANPELEDRVATALEQMAGLSERMTALEQRLHALEARHLPHDAPC